MKINEISMDEFLRQLASRKATPGGGSAAALAGSMAAALVIKVGNLSDNSRAKEIAKQSESLKTQLENLVDEDAEAFQNYITAIKAQKPEVLKQAVRVPIETARASFAVLKLAAEIASIANTLAVTDAAVAALLAADAVEGAALNVTINLKGLEDQLFIDDVQKKLLSFDRVDETRETVLANVKRQINQLAGRGN